MTRCVDGKHTDLRTKNILHLIDTLNAGGAERMAVNLTNELSKRGFNTYLCATRGEGPLKTEITPGVHYLCLFRKSRFDLQAFSRLVRFTRSHEIDIVHAHSSSLFIAYFVAIFNHRIKLIWHDHYGAFSNVNRCSLLYRLFTRNISAVISVNQALKNWAINKLNIPSKKVSLLPNFISLGKNYKMTTLPGMSGLRIISIANLRPQKDHITLIRAMRIVICSESNSHLLMVGSSSQNNVREEIFAEIQKLGLTDHVTWLGSRNDIEALLISCDIGVLSSTSEGLPLALLEYGATGLPVVATDVGDCSFVINSERLGTLVPPRSPEALAEGILNYLRNPALAKDVGANLQNRVNQVFNADVAMKQLVGIYEQVLDEAN